jgi:hypothetical protein
MTITTPASDALGATASSALCGTATSSRLRASEREFLRRLFDD